MSESSIPAGVCRYCLRPEHPSGTICRFHSDLIPDVPIGCDVGAETREEWEEIKKAISDRKKEQA